MEYLVFLRIIHIERLSGGFTAEWFGTPHGIVISTGSTFAIIAYLIGMFINRPSVARMAAIGKATAEKGGQPSPEQMQELQKLRTELFTSINATAVLVLLASLAMSMARYF